MFKEIPQLPGVYRQLLDAIDIGIHVINHEGKSIIYNKKMSEIEDMNKEEVLNKSIMDIFLFNSEEESRLLQALSNGSVHRNAKQTYFNFKGQEITTINDTFPLVHNDMRIGAVEIAKDITKLERLTRETSREKHDAKFTFEQIIGESSAIKEVVHNAQRATRTSSSVLISGETGTGKELFAQSIHNGSHRSAKPFISQNCAALPDSLIEGILFGSVKGAFTGATDHPGLFEQADGGTLMLDEINSLNASLQAKLLRAIQEKSIRRIGDTKNRTIDVRIIATVNEDPLLSLEKNRLREDLYYRLSVVSLTVPPLRKRKEDISLLADHFVQKYNHRFQLHVPGLADEVSHFFKQYDWPGNVRELEHMIEGAMNLIDYDEPIHTIHLPVHVRKKFPLPANDMTIGDSNSLKQKGVESAVKPLHAYIEEVEKMYLANVLSMYNGNISQAAEKLGIKRQSLQYRRRKYNL
ncbi:sigma 54-interacting transcriptional regulator [Salipaludibacillus agaradhaerens]|uniref:sigma-54 interaction domain-containing protein n=1 Tax=Salipaludibacillus agaradhaerens TaxID=76935 RepID=UPI002150BCCA|nr:sigma 54-interacting transcriptional regulator [Salipaludibacillus agaradhaerens]MCR6105330.1 sigma 54-interacting transcriptional regulator [Salipaludibacillus agaradhaerens]MCR6117371.1 sigma 54-interacting transcriptional regulator [Salipaludibacillus agaradhaerens]